VRASSPQRPPMRRILRPAGLAVAVGLVTTGCTEGGVFDTLNPKGENARIIDDLTNFIGIAALAVGVVITVLVTYTVYRYRSTDETYDDLPEQVHGHTAAELTWTVVPAIGLIVVTVLSLPAIFELDRQDPDDMTVLVEGQQWWWQFSYDLDNDGVYEIVTSGDIVFPAGQQVNLQITSNDVIHSFWVPELTGKKDAVPGLRTPLKLHADEPGIFWGQCAEFCGLSHAEMRLRAVALDDADWERWVSEQTTVGVVPDGQDVAAQRGYETFGQFCSSCHVIDGVYEGAYENEPPLLSGIAPNLTNLMGRTSFAGGIFDLYNDDGTVNEADLLAWVRDAPGVKALDPANQQGMPSFAEQLSNEQLSDIVAYLSTLGEAPILP